MFSSSFNLLLCPLLSFFNHVSTTVLSHAFCDFFHGDICKKSRLISNSYPYVMKHGFKITSFSQHFCTVLGAFFIDLFRCVSSTDPYYIHPNVITNDNDWHNDIWRPFGQKMRKNHENHLISSDKIFNMCICDRIFLMKYLEGCIDATNLRPLEWVG